MDPWPLALAPEMTAGDALEQIRKFEGEISDCLFVSNGQRKPAGVLSPADLLRVTSRETLSAIMRPAVHKVPALASVTLVADHPGWEEFHVLPVMERENRLVGALGADRWNAEIGLDQHRPVDHRIRLDPCQ